MYIWAFARLEMRDYYNAQIGDLKKHSIWIIGYHRSSIMLKSISCINGIAHKVQYASSGIVDNTEVRSAERTLV